LVNKYNEQIREKSNTACANVGACGHNDTRAEKQTMQLLDRAPCDVSGCQRNSASEEAVGRSFKGLDAIS